MIKMNYRERGIEVSYRGKVIFTVEDTEFGMEVFDCVNSKIINISRSPFIQSVFEEVQPYLKELIKNLNKSQSNQYLDVKRKQVLESRTKQSKKIGSD